VVVDLIREVLTAAIAALLLALLDVDEDIIGKAYVHERVKAAAEGLEGLSFLHVAGEVGKHESVLSLRAEAKELNIDALLDEGVAVASVNHIAHAKEEGVRELGLLAGLLHDVLDDLVHRNDGDSDVDCEALGDLLLEGVGGCEEDDLGVGGPSLDEGLICLEDTLLDVVLNVTQPHFIFIDYYFMFSTL